MIKPAAAVAALTPLTPLAFAALTMSSSAPPAIHWIGGPPSYATGSTFGVPWPEGQLYPNDTSFAVTGAVGGARTDVASDWWPTGLWRDGSIKWSAHALGATAEPQDEYTIKPAAKSKVHGRTGHVAVRDSASSVAVDTGNITVTFSKSGSTLIESIETAAGKTVAKNGTLVLHSQSALPADVASRAEEPVTYHNFESNITNVTVTSSDSGVRSLVTTRGKFRLASGGGEHGDWLPFVVRFYLYSGSTAIRVIHSVVLDGDPHKDFISGLGIRLRVPLAGEELYNRHVRFSGQEGGFFSEAVQGITGLRRDPGQKVRAAQVAGKATPDVKTWDKRVSERLKWVPSFGDYKLSQATSEGFAIRKRTTGGYTWLNSASGTRSGGLGYLGGPNVGGVAIGLRDFWQQSPSGIDIADAASDEGSITLWLYSPDAEPLDLRPYHGTMGLDTYESQLDALEITYEDYEPGFDTPRGIAKTHEVYIHALNATPALDQLGRLTTHLAMPPALAAEPGYIRSTKALGSYWNVPDMSSNKTRVIEENLSFLIGFYRGQVWDRRFYGFLHYGDFMHTYDADRHTWRYDVGGYAWDNSELSPDLFFWQHFLRTQRADLYRFAEALTRHTGEVDVYHSGDWKGLGTRHGVLHYGDSAKQARIAQPHYRRYYYYLSGGDERVGELLDEALDADLVYGKLDPQRKVRDDGWTPQPGKPAAISLGTDWAGLAAGWLLGWERRGPRWEEARDKLTNTAAAIGTLKNGFVTGSALLDVENRTLLPPPADPDNAGIVDVSHLSAVFGLPEVVSELLEYWGDEAPAGFRDAWLDYCYYYDAKPAEQKSRYGEAFGKPSLIQGHSRLAAFHYAQSGDAAVGRRAWTDFYRKESDSLVPKPNWNSRKIRAPAVPVPVVHESAWVSTNSAAQFGLAAIQNLAWAREALEE